MRESERESSAIGTGPSLISEAICEQGTEILGNSNTLKTHKSQTYTHTQTLLRGKYIWLECTLHTHTQIIKATTATSQHWRLKCCDSVTGSLII